MDKSIEVEVMDFSNYGPDSFVFIYVNTGKMPVYKVQKYLKNVKESLDLCRMLEGLGIAYNLIPCPASGGCSGLPKSITAEIVEKKSTQLELELVPKDEVVTKFSIDVGNTDTKELINKINMMVERGRKNKKFSDSIKVVEG